MERKRKGQITVTSLLEVDYTMQKTTCEDKMTKNSKDRNRKGKKHKIKKQHLSFRC